MRRAIIAFFPAVLGAYILGSIFATQVILAQLQALAMPITLRDRLYASWQDLLGLSGSYLPLLLLAFLVAMPLAGALAGRASRFQFVFYALGGAAAVMGLHLGLESVLGFNALAAVRETRGLLLQGLAGWFGGYLFFVFTGQAHR